MSRSYKHTPYSGDIKSKFDKRYANHVVRRNKLKDMLPQHAGYRKIYESWWICDYKTFGESFEQFYADAVATWRWCMDRQIEETFPDRRESKKEYEKRYIRK